MGIVAVAVFVCVCNCWYYGCCEACCEMFESDDPPTPKSTQEVGQALISGRRPVTSGMTLCYLCNTEIINFLWDNGRHRRTCAKTTKGKETSYLVHFFILFLFKEGETGGDVTTCVRFLPVWRQTETVACYGGHVDLRDVPSRQPGVAKEERGNKPPCLLPL